MAPAKCATCAGQLPPQGPLFYGDHLDDAAALEQTLVGPFHTGPNCWAAKQPVSPLVHIPGFSIWRCMCDLMHTLDLGLLQRIVPAALQGLMVLPPATARESL